MTDRTHEGGQAVWIVDELTVPEPLPSKNESRAKEEKEIKEKFLKEKQPPSWNSNSRHGHDKMTFWDKYFEMQVHNV